MKIYIGYAFTDTPIRNLRERGFSLQESSNNVKQGWRVFTALFRNQSAFQIWEILDEQEFLREHPIQHFEPRTLEQNVNAGEFHHPNTVINLRKALFSDDEIAGSIAKEFGYRKQGPLWALWLECEHFRTMENVARPDIFLDWNDTRAGLLQMGPNCFDLLITEYG